MTLLTLVCALREHLVEAIEQNDKDALEKLQTTLGVLEDISCTDVATPVCGIFQDLEQSTSYAIMGVGWKAPVLSVQEIESALSGN